jgi:hypothetical protein
VEIGYNYFPRVNFGPGPWADEPDHVQFEWAGLPCLAVRQPDLGSWCGYAGVPPGHPLHGVDSDSDLLDGIHSRREVDYSAACFGLICHLAKPGEDEPVWWFGMHFSHAFDLSPGTEFTLQQLLAKLPEDYPGAGYVRANRSDGKRGMFQQVYRDLNFVKRSVCELAEWLAYSAVRPPA